MFWLIVGVAGAILWTVYYVIIKPHRYWYERGIEQGRPLPLFGHSFGTLFRLETFPQLIEKIYQIGSGVPYNGFYQFYIPILSINDPEIIKTVTCKDFDHFVDHRTVIPEDIDPLWGKNLFALTGRRWREMRSLLSPSFSSNKMKYMFSLISEAAEQMVTYFCGHDDTVISVEMKDICTRFANDVIASTSFGVRVNSLKDRTNEFYMMGKDATNFTSLPKFVKLIGYFFGPKLYALLNIQLFSDKVRNFFNQLISDSIRQRQQNNIIRPDMIHLMLEARKRGRGDDDGEIEDDQLEKLSNANHQDISKKSAKRLEISDEDITAQALIFFFAGFDTSAGLMCFMAHELAVNSAIQDRLYKEIQSVNGQCNGKLTYEALNSMKYMDMVVSETLRKWPIVVAVDRVCTKAYTLMPPENRAGMKPLHLEKGASLWIPIYAIHRDAKYYPEPEKFLPERFSDENKARITPYTYMPFGVGPRICIGSRFALLEVKSFFFHLLANFEIVVNDKTNIPLIIHKQSFNLTAQNGFWLDLRKRTI